jgi:hypothetical protein
MSRGEPARTPQAAAAARSRPAGHEPTGLSDGEIVAGGLVTYQGIAIRSTVAAALTTVSVLGGRALLGPVHAVEVALGGVVSVLFFGLTSLVAALVERRGDHLLKALGLVYVGKVVVLAILAYLVPVPAAFDRGALAAGAVAVAVVYVIVEAVFLTRLFHAVQPPGQLASQPD